MLLEAPWGSLRLLEAPDEIFKQEKKIICLLARYIGFLPTSFIILLNLQPCSLNESARLGKP